MGLDNFKSDGPKRHNIKLSKCHPCTKHKAMKGSTKIGEKEYDDGFVVYKEDVGSIISNYYKSLYQMR